MKKRIARIIDAKMQPELAPITPEPYHLPFMSLELNTTIVPTWDSPEPTAFVVELNGEITVVPEEDDTDEEIKIGKIEAYRLNLQHASNCGCSWDDVLDAHSADLANYLRLIGRREFCYSAWIEKNLEPFGDMLVLHKIRIEPVHRGHGYGLLAAQLMIDSFGPQEGVVACIPAPYELLEERDTDDPRPFSERVPGWAAAQKRLRQYWARLGFQAVPKTDIFALSTAHKQPAIEDVMKAYLARHTTSSKK